MRIWPGFETHRSFWQALGRRNRGSVIIYADSASRHVLLSLAQIILLITLKHDGSAIQSCGRISTALAGVSVSRADETGVHLATARERTRASSTSDRFATCRRDRENQSHR